MRVPFGLAIVFLIILALYASCIPTHEKTGEVEIFRSKDIKVVVIQRYEAMPWHYYGLTHEVLCQTPKTNGLKLIAGSPVSIPGQGPSKEVRKSGLEAAAARESIKIIDSETIVSLAPDRFSVSFDLCQNFSNWNSRNISTDDVVQVQKPRYCRDGDNYCPWWVETFSGDNQISFSIVKINPQARTISFLAHSKALKGGELRVSSVDGGRSWQTAGSK